MGQIISFINMKGGVGKTTLAANIGHTLVDEYEKKVLLVDADPQFNASTYLMSDKEYIAYNADSKKKTILDIFSRTRHDSINSVKGKRQAVKKGGISIDSCTFRVSEQGEGYFDLIPSTLALMEIQNSPRGTENKLANFLKSKSGAYDYILIDCPPTISIFSQAAILASQKYIVPLKPDPLSATGLPLLERWLADTTDSAGVDVESVGIVFCMVRSPLTNTMSRVMRDLRDNRTDEVFDSYLTQSTDVATSVEKHKAVSAYMPGSKWALEISEITLEFLERTDGV